MTNTRWPLRKLSKNTKTDDFGFKAIENPVHPNDIHATVLHQLGLDHKRLSFRHSGRDFRLTDVKGTVVKDLIA